MAKKASSSGGRGGGAGGNRSAESPKKRKQAVARRTASNDQGFDAGDLLRTLLQSPLVAELLAVAATAALAALAQHGFNRSGAGGDKRRSGGAVREAGKAAAAAIGQRLANEVGEIRDAARRAKQSAGL
jgi:hypothetical protein